MEQRMKKIREAMKEFTNFCRNFLKNLYIAKAEREKNQVVVENILSTENYVEVFPNKVPKRYYTFIKSELVDLAKFFAVLDKDDSEITIVLKFNKKEEYYFVEKVQRKNFWKCYKIKELVRVEMNNPINIVVSNNS